MALAHLQLLDRLSGKFQFLLDTGTSPFFEFVIGKSKTEKNGVPFVDEIQKKTGIKRRAVSNPLRTNSEITLDSSLFVDDSRFIQLFTYRDENGKGASFSKVVEVVPKLFVRNDAGDLPDIKLPKLFSMSTSYQVTGRVPQSFSEPKMSEAMFFASLLPIVSKILPVASNLLGGLAGGGGGAGGLGGILGKILPMVSGLLGGGGAPTGGGGGGGENAQAPVQGGGPNLAELLKPETIQAIKGLIDQFTQKGNMSGQKSVTEPTASPGLLQMLPIIAPVLEKIISPQAIAALGTNPEKLYAALADGIAHLPVNDIISIKKLLVQTRPSEYVKAKSTNYSQPMFWQALLSLATPDMVNAVGNQTNNTMKTAQEGILNLKKEQARFVEALIPKGDINQPVIKDMINAISQYNLLTHQPPAQQAPSQQQSVAQSIGAFTSALCQVIPAIEQSLSNDSVMDETQEKTKEFADKVQNQFMKLQEDVRKKMLDSMKEKIEQQVENIDLKSLSLQFSHNTKERDGLTIFNCNGNYKKKASADKAAKTLSRLLPMAVAKELRETSSILSSKNGHHRQYRSSDPAVALMLQKIDEAASVAKTTIPFKHDGRFNLEVAGAKTVAVNGTQKCVYVAEKGIRFAVTVQGSKKEKLTIPKCIIQVQIRTSQDKNVLVDKKFPLTDVQTGAIVDSLQFSTEEIKNLQVNTDLLVCFTLVWRDKNKQVKGTRKCHSIMMTSGYLFDGTQSVIKSAIPLNNITEHREFWHKIWEGRSPAGRKRTNIDCKYFMQYEPSSPRNNQIETKTLLKKGKEVSDSEYEADDDFIKIKSGLQLSPQTLNALIPKISKFPALPEKQLNAIRGQEAKKLLESAGIGHVEFKTRRDETNMLWVYPEVDLLEINFKKANAINPYGNVLDFIDEKAVFVKPASIHFIGTKN